MIDERTYLECRDCVMVGWCLAVLLLSVLALFFAKPVAPAAPAQDVAQPISATATLQVEKE